MALGLDYVSGPSIDAMKANNVTFVCRYLSQVNSATQVKLLRPDEAKSLTSAGIAIVSNYEWYASRATEGHDAGAYDAQLAQSQHAACGGPADRPIYFSVDEDVDGLATADYFRGVAGVIGLARTGAYGSYRVIKYLLDNNLISWGWQTYAWSYGQWDARAHIQQYENGATLAGASVDYNRSMQSDFGQWGAAMQKYSPQSADFNTWFTRNDDTHWTCKQTGCMVHDAILTCYESLSIDGQTLPVIGLPTTNEIYITVNEKQVVIMVFERAGIGYDPEHVKDRQPGMGSCFLFHLTDPDFLQHIPNLPALTPTPMPNVTEAAANLEAASAAINTAATLVSKAVASLKQ